MKKFINSRTIAGKGGFTLIELLVVIGIIGVLASMVTASLTSARRKSRDLRRIADVKQLQLALELYFSGHNEYPDDINLLVGANCGGSYCIRTIPQDPVGGNSYPYIACTTTYHLAAGLEERGSPVLRSDADAAPDTVCAGDTIDGRLENDDSSDACTGGGNRNCYDVTSNQ